MRFVVLRNEGTMTIDNQTYPLPQASLDTIGQIVEIIAFNADSGTGFIERNDRPKLLDRSMDPANYEHLINAWMWAAFPYWAAMSDGAAALTQARQIKVRYVDALYHAKRQAPIAYGAYSWNADDDEVDYIIEQISAFDVAAAVVGGINNGTTIGSSITILGNKPVVGLSTNIVNPPLTMPANRFFTLTTNPNITTFSPTASNPTATKSPSTNSIAGGPTIPITPRGSISSVAMSPTDARSLVRAINDRRNSLNQTRAQKKYAYNNTDLGLADVINRSATAGW